MLQEWELHGRTKVCALGLKGNPKKPSLVKPKTKLLKDKGDPELI